MNFKNWIEIFAIGFGIGAFTGAIIIVALLKDLIRPDIRIRSIKNKKGSQDVKLDAKQTQPEKKQRKKLFNKKKLP
jgi:predicted small secreted protein